MNEAYSKVTPYITTRNGTRVEFTSPKPEQIKLDDIIWHLARTCRFNGHMHDWYSNAEHSVHCSRQSMLPNIRRLALIHDFGEFVTGDVTSPVGALCPDYKKLSNSFQECIYVHFMGRLPTTAECKKVKEIDDRMCITEMLCLRGDTDRDYATPYEGVAFKCWEWRDAFHALLERFQQLFPNYKDA